MDHLVKHRLLQKLLHWIPGLSLFFDYQKQDLPFDLKAGLSVAAVALPVSIAYADLTGVGAIAGLYSTILPLIAYALFGSSRQLIIGPDTATCAVIAAVVMPLAVNNPILHWQLVIVMTIMIGFWCLVASKIRLGALADLLSRPMLIGLLNGISITIIIDQIAKCCGFSYSEAQFIPRLIALPKDILQIHLITVLISAVSFALLIFIKKFRPRLPAPLIVLLLITFASWLFNFESFGVKIIGSVENELLPFSAWLNFEVPILSELVVPSINIAVICFISMMITVRSFASKNNYDVDADQELKALGISNIVAGLSNGFVVSGTSSRTAVNDSTGGKTQLVSVIAAVTIAIVVFFFLSPLKYIPVSVLGVILIYSSLSLIDFKSIKRFFKQNRDAFYLSLITFVAVLLIGIIPGIALAVLFGLFLFLRKIFRPAEQLLGMDEEGRIHSISDKVKPLEQTLIYRFNSPLTYFNIAYFRKRILTLIESSPEKINYIIVDTVPSFTYQDVSVFMGISDLVRALRHRQITLILSGRRKTLKRWFEEFNIELDPNYVDFTYDLYFSVKLIQSKIAANAETKKAEDNPDQSQHDQSDQAQTPLELTTNDELSGKMQ